MRHALARPFAVPNPRAITCNLVVAFLVSTLQVGPAVAQDWIFLDGPAYPGQMSAFDWTRQRLVVLGSDGATWEVSEDELLSRQILGSSPPPRSRGAMVYDFVNDRTVLFGGFDSSRTMLNDTWYWDGAQWTQDTSLGRPLGRSDAAMTYDLLRSRVILFGGQQLGVGILDDTWEHDGRQWVSLSPSTVIPAPNAPLMTYDIVRRVAVMITHAGIQGSPVMTWEWDGVDWTLRASTGPTSSGNEGMSYDFARRRVVLVGGVGGEQVVWEWDGNSWQRSTVPNLPSRLDPAIHYNPAIGAIELFGGIDFRVSNGTVLQGATRSDTHVWDGTTLSRRHGDLRPGSRHSHVLAPDPTGKVLLFGGFLQQAAANDTWTWTGNRWMEHAPSLSPSPRSSAAAMLDQGRSETLLFGGSASGVFTNELWAWNGVTWTLRDVGTGPTGRIETTLAFDSGRLVSVLFGGFGRQGTATVPVGDTWEWNGNAWANRSTGIAPSPRAGAAMAFDPRIQRTVLFGGRTGFTAQHQLADTWEWDGNSWQRVSPVTQPPALLSPRLQFEQNTNRLLLVGIIVSTSPFETQVWEYVAGDWAQLHASSNDQVGGTTSLSGNRGRIVSWKQNALAEWTATPAALVRTGPGCGAMVTRLNTRARPRFGDTAFGVETTSIPLQPAVFLLAFAGGAQPLGNGCTLHLGGSLIPVASSVNPFGIATLRLPLPDSPSLRGVTIHSQAVALTPLEPLGMRVSDAIAWTIGD
ncbi:MAG: hypothetical protein AB7I19_10450 [Planctomycetota bacterium]